MDSSGRVRAIVLMAVVLLGGYAGYLGKDLAGIRVDDYAAERIHDIDATGFSVDVSVVVSNPSKLTLRADSVTYRAVLRETGETVASGRMEGVALPRESTTEFSVSPRVDWIPTVSLIAEYATKERVMMDVEMGIVLHRLLPPIEFTVPVDIKEVFSEPRLLGAPNVIENDLLDEVPPAEIGNQSDGGVGGDDAGSSDENNDEESVVLTLEL